MAIDLRKAWEEEQRAIEAARKGYQHIAPPKMAAPKEGYATGIGKQLLGAAVGPVGGVLVDAAFGDNEKPLRDELKDAWNPKDWLKGVKWFNTGGMVRAYADGGEIPMDAAMPEMGASGLPMDLEKLAELLEMGQITPEQFAMALKNMGIPPEGIAQIMNSLGTNGVPQMDMMPEMPMEPPVMEEVPMIAPMPRGMR